MTSVKFYLQEGLLSGFDVSGHSTSSVDDETGKIVCSAVSSASYLVANTISEIIGAEIDAQVSDGHMSVKLKGQLSECQDLLKGFKLHMQELAKQYHNYLKVYSEV